MWISPSDRKHLVEALPGGEKGALMLRDILKLDDCDLFDVLANVGFGTISKTRNERIIAFNYKNKEWLMSLPSNSAAVVKALAVQFKDNGIEELESEHIFDVSDIKRAGGVKALAQINTHVQDVIMEVKKRILAA
jgi:type I restriction enzyme R subunit